MRILDRLVSLCRFEFLARRWGKRGHFKDLDKESACMKLEWLLEGRKTVVSSIGP